MDPGTSEVRKTIKDTKIWINTIDFASPLDLNYMLLLKQK